MHGKAFILIAIALVLMCVFPKSQARFYRRTNPKISKKDTIFFPYRKKDKWGYCDEHKRILIEPLYDAATPFSNRGIARVKLGGNYGYINRKGEVITPFKYTWGYPFLENRNKTVVYVNKMAGMIDLSGKEVLPVIFDNIFGSGDSSDLVGVELNARFGFYNAEMKGIVPAIYDDVKSGSGDRYAVRFDGKWGFINDSGAVVILPQFDNVYPFNKGRAAFSKNKLWGYIDRNGKQVIEPVFDSPYNNALCEIKYFQNEGVWVNKEGKWGLIDTLGNQVIPFVYDEISYFKEGLAYVKKAGKWGYVDRTGREKIPCIYDYAEDFSEGLAEVCSGDKCGYINASGKVEIQFGFQKNYGGNFRKGLAEARKNDLYGFINTKGVEVVPIKYNTIADYNSFDSIMGALQIHYPGHEGRFENDGFYFNKAGTLFFDE